ncbi:MAG: hypothetical protein ABH820_02945 [Patescibacteria group bacterium]
MNLFSHFPFRIFHFVFRALRPSFNSEEQRIKGQERNKPGFTLVEFLIYIVIVAGVVSAATEIIIITLRQNAKLEAIAEVSQNTRIFTMRVDLAVRNANSVTSPAAGATSTRLNLQMASASINPTIFTIQNGRVFLKEGAAATTTLTADEVYVSGYFYNIKPTGAPDAIRTLVNVRASSSGQQIEYNFNHYVSSTAVMRYRL